MAQQRTKRVGYQQYLKAIADPDTSREIMDVRRQILENAIDDLTRAATKYGKEMERNDSAHPSRMSAYRHELIMAAIAFGEQRSRIQEKISFEEYDRYMRSREWSQRPSVRAKAD